MSQYDGNDNYGKPKTDYLAKIASMSNEELLAETADKIWLSSYAANNHRSDYHWQAQACYRQWVERGKIEKYEEAYKQVEDGR